MMRILGRLSVIVLVGIFFTAIVTYPFILNLSSYYYDYGDYALCNWILWYSQHAVITGNFFNLDSYFSTNQFFPFPYVLAYSENLFVPSLMYGVLLSLIPNFVTSMNVFLFSTFVLSFVSSYFCINYFVKKPAAALIGALVFTFNPVTFAHFPGHVHLQNKLFLFPLFLSCYLFFVSPNLKKGFLLSLLFTLNFLTSLHFGAFSVLLLPLFALPVFISGFKSRGRDYVY
jgi:hypothetical protein